MKRRFPYFLIAIAGCVPLTELQARQQVVETRSGVERTTVVRQSPNTRTISRVESRRPARRLAYIGEEMGNDRYFESRRVILRDRPIIFNQPPQFYSDGKTSVGLSFDF